MLISLVSTCCRLAEGAVDLPKGFPFAEPPKIITVSHGPFQFTVAGAFPSKPFQRKIVSVPSSSLVSHPRPRFTGRRASTPVASHVRVTVVSR
jgi:hypothetical protein